MNETRSATSEPVIQDKMEIMIAIGAATAANCIPCFEHLYEKAVNSGITLEEIKRASDIAAQVKTGANIAITNCVNELLGTKETFESGRSTGGQQACSC